MNLTQNLIEAAFNNEPLIAEAKGKVISLNFCDKKITPPFDFKNKNHGLKFFSFSKLFFKEYQSINDKAGNNFYLKDFKDYTQILDFFDKNDYFFIGVDIDLSNKVLLRETKLYPNLGYIYAEKSFLKRFFNVENLEKSDLKDFITQHFIPSLESFLNGEVYELFIKDKESERVKLCYGSKNVEALINLELAS